MAGQPGFRRWAARYERASISRSKLVPFSRINAEIDIRHVLPSIYAPTLVMHARGDRVVPYPERPVPGRAHRGCTVPGAPHRTTTRRGSAPGRSTPTRWRSSLPARDRMRTTHESSRRSSSPTSSTRRCTPRGPATQRGATSWTVTMTCAASRLGSAAGRWIKSTGDGLLATFDSPSRAVRCAWALTRPHPIRTRDRDTGRAAHGRDRDARRRRGRDHRPSGSADSGRGRELGGDCFGWRAQSRRRFRHRTGKPRDTHPERHCRAV